MKAVLEVIRDQQVAAADMQDAEALFDWQDAELEELALNDFRPNGNQCDRLCVQVWIGGDQYPRVKHITVGQFLRMRDYGRSLRVNVLDAYQQGFES